MKQLESAFADFNLGEIIYATLKADLENFKNHIKFFIKIHSLVAHNRAKYNAILLFRFFIYFFFLSNSFLMKIFFLKLLDINFMIKVFSPHFEKRKYAYISI